MEFGRKLDEKTLREFIVSRQNTWPTGEPRGTNGLVAYESTARFDEGNFELLWTDARADAGQDTYVGQAVVSFRVNYRNLPILAIQYRAKQFVDHRNRKAVNEFLRRALLRGPHHGDFFRGPRDYTFRNFCYKNEQSGGVTSFSGTESIRHSESLVHLLKYECRSLVNKLPKLR